MTPLQPAASDWFSGVFILVAVVVALGFAFAIGTAVYRSTRMARRGQNPLTVREDLAWQAANSPTLQPARSKAERLAELDRLHAAGTISDTEHAEARARILAE